MLARGELATDPGHSISRGLAQSMNWRDPGWLIQVE
jgi:hypothetical protein